MRRWALRICVFLLLGAVINVAVAWGCSLWLQFPKSRPVTLTGGAWPSYVPSHWPGEAAHVWHGAKPGLTIGIRNAQSPDDDMKGMTYARITSGWPRLSMQMDFLSERYMRDPRQVIDRRGSFGSGIATRLGVRTDPGLPYQGLAYWPIWAGFAINTLFYAAILSLPFVGFALRRWRRIKRGLCPKCAYDLRNRPSDSSVCPECGAGRLSA